MFRTQQVFKKHVFGEGSISIQVSSDQRANFGGRCVNYEDPNLSVQLPIFVIHGNHDDPSREGTGGALSAIDILAEAGLVNYFGQSDKTDDIRISPVLIEKDNVKLALYGLGWIRDERLHRAFLSKKVIFTQATEDTASWFNLMLIHQNRDQKGRGAKNCVAEVMIPDFMDLVVWGHEHECLIDPVPKGKWFLSQPGSSIAASLVEGEALQKHVAVFELKFPVADSSSSESSKQVTYRMVKIPLKTVRPFLLDTSIELAKVESVKTVGTETDRQESVFTFLTAKVNQILEDHLATLPPKPEHDQQDEHGHNVYDADDQRARVPLVRLKVEHSGNYPLINLQRFGAQFVRRVANPDEMIQFWKKRLVVTSEGGGEKKKKRGADGFIVSDDDDEYTDGGSVNDDDDLLDATHDRIRKLAEQSLGESKQRLCVLPADQLALAVEEFAVKETTSAIETFVNERLEALQKMIRKDRQEKSGPFVTEEIVLAMSEKLNKKDVDRTAKDNLKREEDDLAVVDEHRAEKKETGKKMEEVVQVLTEDEEDEEEEVAEHAKKVKARGKRKAEKDEGEDEEEMEEVLPSKKKRSTPPTRDPASSEELTMTRPKAAAKKTSLVAKDSPAKRAKVAESSNRIGSLLSQSKFGGSAAAAKKM